MSVSGLTKDLKDLTTGTTTTANIISNFQSLLKEGEASRYSTEELGWVCRYTH